MNKIDDGGPAFSQPLVRTEGGGIVTAEEMSGAGMSLRDYFAAAALQGFLTIPVNTPGSMATWQIAAAEAYAAADAMLLARRQS